MILNRCRLGALALVFCSPLAAHAASEALAAAAARDFQAAAFGPLLRPAVPRAAAVLPPTVQMSAVLDSWDDFIQQHTNLASETPAPAASTALAADLDLKVLLNHQLKTRLRYSMGGKTVWCGGVFDRQQNAYLSVLVDGEAARYYDIKDIYKHEKTLKIGNQTYRLWLSANIFNRIKSSIVFTNIDDENDETRFTLKTMLGAVSDAGAAVALSGQSYRVFYTDGLRGNQADPAARIFTFLTTESNGDLHIYLIPEDIVPADRIAVFKMFNDLPVGLTRSGDSLKVYTNP